MKKRQTLRLETGVGPRRWTVHLPVDGTWTMTRWCTQLAERGPYASGVFDVCEEAERATGRPCVWERHTEDGTEMKTTAELRAWYVQDIRERIKRASLQEKRRQMVYFMRNRAGVRRRAA